MKEGLAPKKRAPSLQARMAQNIDDLAAEFRGFNLMMQQVLDKINGFKAWHSTADEKLGVLMTKTTETASRITVLEA